MPDAAGGEGGHGAAKADPVSHTFSTSRSSFGGSEVGSIEEASAVMRDRLIKTQQIASSTTTRELSLAYHAVVRDP